VEIPSLQGRVSVQGVESLGGHFAILCRGFDFYEVKKKYYFPKTKGKYILSQFKKVKYYDPQSARINVQSPQSESTPRRLTLLPGFVKLTNSKVKVGSSASYGCSTEGYVMDNGVKQLLTCRDDGSFDTR
jgi:hypothetical protein